LCFLLALLLLTPAPALATKVTVPINIGVGPALYQLSGPIRQDQTLHYGLAFSGFAVVDNETIRKFRKRIPRKYRSTILKIDEMRISHFLIPDSFFISPKTVNTGIYGIGWQPLKLGLTLSKKPRLWIGIGVRITYFYLHSDGFEGVQDGQAFSMHFLRPGLDAASDFEIPFSDSFLMSVGWVSQFHLPQPVGGGIGDWGSTDESIWHIGQAYLKLHFRFPYTANI